MKVFVIIGGGFSGAITAIHLMRLAKLPIQIIVIEKSENGIGKGLAYSTNNPLHLLNVPAGKMSCLSEYPNHLIEYLKGIDAEYSDSTFIPREVYGKYVNGTFDEHLNTYSKTHKINVIRSEVINITVSAQHASVQLSNHETIVCDKVVFAVGNFEPSDPKVNNNSFTISPNYIKDPFKKGAIGQIPVEKDVLIVGTGLTAIDILLTLDKNGHRGKIMVISNHGYLPVQHKLGSNYPDYYSELKDKFSSLELLQVVRKHFLQAVRNGTDYRAVIDVIRPHTQQIWCALSISEKRRFLNHLRHLWGVARHRMPEKIYTAIQNMLHTGKVSLTAGRLIDVSVSADQKFSIIYKERRKKEEKKLAANYIINCTGPESNYEKINSPLIKNLLNNRVIVKDEINCGIKASVTGKVVDSNKKESDVFFTIGPPMKGVLWECTAVPEIREQAFKLAQTLLKE